MIHGIHSTSAVLRRCTAASAAAVIVTAAAILPGCEASTDSSELSVLKVSQPSPRLVVSEPHRDLGVVTPGSTHTIQFALRNEGSAVLAVFDVETSCGCTDAVVEPKRIEPGETGTLTVSVTIPKSVAPVRNIVEIKSSDPGQERAMLEVVATPKWEALASPEVVRLSVLEEGVECSSEVELYSQQDRPFNITDVDCSSECISVQKLDLRSGRHRYRIQVIPNRPGTINEIVSFYTDLPSGRVIRLPIVAEVIGAGMVIPPRLVLGQRRSREKVQVVCMLRPGAGSGLHQHVSTDIPVAPDSNEWSVEARRQDADSNAHAGHIRVALSIRVPAVAGYHRTSVVVDGELEIPLSCYVVDE